MKTIIIMMLAIITLATTACASKDSFTINGTITGLTDGTEICLVPGSTHKQEKPIATTTLSNGKFTFSGQVESPRMFYIQLKENSGVIQVMVENGVNTTVTSKVETRDNNGQEWTSFSDTKVSGSPIHEEFLKKMAFKEELEQMFMSKNEKHKVISAQIGEARMNKNKTLMDSLAKTKEYQEMAADENLFFKAAGEKTKQAVMNNKNSWWGPFLMLQSMSWFEEEQKEWFANFSPEVQKSYYGQIVYKELHPETLEGKQAPDFTVTDSQGKTLTLQELIKGKKYTLIDFWASWCGPCRREIPNLKALYKEFATKGLEIISISIDKDNAAWQKAFQEEQFPWPNFLDKSNIADAYEVKLIPAIFLVDSTGKVLSIKLRGKALEEKIKELLK